MRIIRCILATLTVFMTVFMLSSCRAKTGEESVKKENTGIHREFERGPVKAVIDIDKLEISIADRLNLKLSLIADEGYEVKLPGFGDNLEQWGIVDYHTAQPKLLDRNKTEVSRSYVLEPFLSGTYKIPPMQIKFFKKGEEEAKAQEQEHVLETEEIEIIVKSILPEKMSGMKIHDIFPPVLIPFQHMKAVWISAGVIIIITLLVSGILIWRKYFRKAEETAGIIPAHETAYLELENLVAENLLEKGEIKKFYQEISNILRRYIENRFGLHAPEQTTEEFLQDINGRDVLKPEFRRLLKTFLTHCDLVKFAEHKPENEDIQKTFDSCKNFIAETAENGEGQGDKATG